MQIFNEITKKVIIDGVQCILACFVILGVLVLHYEVVKNERISFKKEFNNLKEQMNQISTLRN